MNKIFLLLLVFFLVFGCTQSNIVLPYTTSQLIAQSTDLNYIDFVNGVYDGNYLMIDNNKLSVGAIDINSYDIDWSKLINFPSGCADNQAVKIVGSSLVCVDLPIDTNFETAGLSITDINNVFERVGTTIIPKNISDDFNFINEDGEGITFNIQSLGQSSNLDFPVLSGYGDNGNQKLLMMNGGAFYLDDPSRSSTEIYLTNRAFNNAFIIGRNTSTGNTTMSSIGGGDLTINMDTKLTNDVYFELSGIYTHFWDSATGVYSIGDTIFGEAGKIYATLFTGGFNIESVGTNALNLISGTGTIYAKDNLDIDGTLNVINDTNLRATIIKVDQNPPYYEPIGLHIIQQVNDVTPLEKTYGILVDASIDTGSNIDEYTGLQLNMNGDSARGLLRGMAMDVRPSSAFPVPSLGTVAYGTDIVISIDDTSGTNHVYGHRVISDINTGKGTMTGSYYDINRPVDGWAIYVENGKTELNDKLEVNDDVNFTKDLNVDGNVHSSNYVFKHKIWHAFGGFEDAMETINLTQNVWHDINNIDGNLWGGNEVDGFSFDSDRIVISNGADYSGNLVVTLSGLANTDFEVRIYNVTQDRKEGFHISFTGLGVNNYVPVSLPIYLEASSNDVFALQVRNISNNNDVTIGDGSFFINYLHD